MVIGFSVGVLGFDKKGWHELWMDGWMDDRGTIPMDLFCKSLWNEGREA
jgi:hypothetical protein